MHELALPLLFGLIFVALAFDFINGLHDAANSIATVVVTRVLTPGQAVAWAAFFNSIAFLFIGLHVAETVGKGIVDPTVIDPAVVFGALVGAISWNVITWYFGLPSSSSHALVGGLVGAGVTKGGLGAIVASGVIKVSIFIFAAPLLGMLAAVTLVILTSWLFKPVPAKTADKSFRRMQLASSAAYSIGHGANDAQKTMGIIAVLLF
ncbi:MAG: inorganic phosphate transporter, partial [Sphingomicrobium sp.]